MSCANLKKPNGKLLIFFLGTALLAGAIGSLLGGNMRLDTMNTPPLTPPAILFPIVWTILYLLMGTAAYLVAASEDLDRTVSLRVYFLQLAVNALWPLFFFRLQWLLFAFFWLLLLIALITLTMAGFRRICSASYWMMVPYLLWCLFASYLNLGLYLLAPSY